MKDIYTAPSLEIICFETEDVITTSTQPVTDPESLPIIQ